MEAYTHFLKSFFFFKFGFKKSKSSTNLNFLNFLIKKLMGFIVQFSYKNNNKN